MILIARPRILSLLGRRLQLLEYVYSSVDLEFASSPLSPSSGKRILKRILLYLTPLFKIISS